MAATILSWGGAGDDWLIGGDGHDELLGGDGDDDLEGGAGNDSLSGGAGLDELEGGDGDDYLDGGADGDIMAGRAGNDVYVVNDSGDAIFEAGGEGIDEVRTAGSYTLGSAIENFRLTGSSAVAGTGNELANTLTGNGAANALSGLAGNDILTGGAGTDTLTGGSGDDAFQDTGAGLSGDTIADFAAGDRIVISDASLAGFTFSLAGNTLTFTGGSLTLTGFTGQLQASAAAGGGVQLTVVPVVIADFSRGRLQRRRPQRHPLAA